MSEGHATARATAETGSAVGGHEIGLKRALKLRHLVLYGIIVIQPTAPMPAFGVIHETGRGHVVTAILIAMVAMLFTAISYGRMARAYPSAGSAFTYVGSEMHASLGYATGWSMTMDYMLNPLICTIWCSQAALNFFPNVPYVVWAVFFAGLFTTLNLRGVETSARVNLLLAAFLGVVIVAFLASAVSHVVGVPQKDLAFFTRPFYDPQTFEASALFAGTSIAVLTYIGFDGISTLSEEVENPRRNILLATVLVCLVTGLLAATEVYFAQLVWPAGAAFPNVDTAIVSVAGEAGGPWLFALVNFGILVATIGSGTGAHLGAARLLYGMGRNDAIPKRFFGAVNPKTRIPQNAVLFVGTIALLGAMLVQWKLMSFQLGVELLNFGALIAFMGVNAAAFVRYVLRDGHRGLTYILPPLLGFATCLFLWLNLSWTAKIAGAVWLAFGLVYGAIRTRGFVRDLVRFDVPQ
jgi:amino acid transporter